MHLDIFQCFIAFKMQRYCVLCQNKGTINYNCRLDMPIYLKRVKTMFNISIVVVMLKIQLKMGRKSVNPIAIHSKCVYAFDYDYNDKIIIMCALAAPWNPFDGIKNEMKNESLKRKSQIQQIVVDRFCVFSFVM